MLIRKNIWAIAATMAEAFLQQDIPVLMVPNNIKKSTSIP